MAVTPAPNAFSIKLFLVDGTPEGLRIVEKSNWTGLGLVCTRTQYSDVRTRPEFDGAAVYVLLGPGNSSLPRVYIGEAEVLRKRLDQHHTAKEFWNRTTPLIHQVLRRAFFLVDRPTDASSGRPRTERL